jgi:hypothetical protein
VFQADKNGWAARVVARVDHFFSEAQQIAQLATGPSLGDGAVKYRTEMADGECAGGVELGLNGSASFGDFGELLAQAGGDATLFGERGKR